MLYLKSFRNCRKKIRCKKCKLYRYCLSLYNRYEEQEEIPYRKVKKATRKRISESLKHYHRERKKALSKFGISQKQFSRLYKSKSNISKSGVYKSIRKTKLKAGSLYKTDVLVTYIVKGKKKFFTIQGVGAKRRRTLEKRIATLVNQQLELYGYVMNKYINSTSKWKKLKKVSKLSIKVKSERIKKS